MCRWLAYIGRPYSIEPLVYDGDHSLSHLARHSYMSRLGVQGDGGGLGWYTELPDPGLYRNPGPAWADPNLRQITRHIESRVTFAHIRASSGTPDIFVNCHPFRYGRWLFMHNGQIGGFERLKRHLLAHLSDESFAALEGGTDSEFFFQLLVTKGLEEDPGEALRTAVRLVEKERLAAGEAEGLRATFALTDGWRFWAVRWSSDGEPPTLFSREGERHLLLVSEPLDEDVTQWHEVKRNSLLSAELYPDWHVSHRVERFL